MCVTISVKRGFQGNRDNLELHTLQTSLYYNLDPTVFLLSFEAYFPTPPTASYTFRGL